MPEREFTVWVTASGVAVVVAKTKKEAIEKARHGDFAGTPLPHRWYAQVSTVREREDADA